MNEKVEGGKQRQEPTVLGIPWDWRRPTWERVKLRTWNPADDRLFTPTPFGHGHVVNGYWVAHPISYVRARRRREPRESG